MMESDLKLVNKYQYLKKVDTHPVVFMNDLIIKL